MSDEEWATEVARFADSLTRQTYARRTVEMYVQGARDLLGFLASRGRTPATLTVGDLLAFHEELERARGRFVVMAWTGPRRFLKDLLARGLVKADQVLPALNRVKPRQAHPLPPKFKQALGELDLALAAADLAVTTRERYAGVWRGFFWYLAEEEGIEDLSAVTRAVLSDYRVKMKTRESARGTPYAASSQRQVLAALRFFFVWLVRSGQLLADPTRHLSWPRAAQTLPRVPSVSEISCVLRSLPRTATGLRDRAALELLYGTGLRGSELVRLDLTDADLLEDTLLIREGKGRKDRLVPLLGQAKQALVDYLERGRGALQKGRESQAVFVCRFGARMLRSWLTERVRELGRRVGVVLRPHLLRHACATHLLRGRADIRQIQRLLGHKTLSTTERYTRVEVQDLRAVVARCHPRERSR